MGTRSIDPYLLCHFFMEWLEVLCLQQQTSRMVAFLSDVERDTEFPTILRKGKILRRLGGGAACELILGETILLRTGVRFCPSTVLSVCQDATPKLGGLLEPKRLSPFQGRKYRPCDMGVDFFSMKAFTTAFCYSEGDTPKRS